MASGERTLLVVGGMGELGWQVTKAASAMWEGAVLSTFRNTIPNAEQRSLPNVSWVHLDCSDHKSVRNLFAGTHRIISTVYCAVPKHGGSSGKGGEHVRGGIVDDVVACAEAAAMIGARFVAVSTDLVYDGNMEDGHLYKEEDAVTPMNAYGKYKAEMEKQLSAISGSIAIARTSLILTIEDTHFGKGVQFVVDALNGKHGQIEIFTDELRNMSFSDDLGKALVELADTRCTHVGLIHVVSDEVTNRWELTKLLAKKLKLEDKLGVHARSGLSSESGLNRPLNCALSTELRSKVLKTKIMGITERLR